MLFYRILFCKRKEILNGQAARPEFHSYCVTGLKVNEF